jgi:hypothetical protein
VVAGDFALNLVLLVEHSVFGLENVHVCDGAGRILLGFKDSNLLSVVLYFGCQVNHDGLQCFDSAAESEIFLWLSQSCKDFLALRLVVRDLLQSCLR